MRPSYAPPFHDLSEIGPGVSRATLNCLLVDVAGLSEEPEQAPKVIAKKAVRSVEKSDLGVEIF
jgi:hypothetical protein